MTAEERATEILFAQCEGEVERGMFNAVLASLDTKEGRKLRRTREIIQRQIEADREEQILQGVGREVARRLGFAGPAE